MWAYQCGVKVPSGFQGQYALAGLNCFWNLLDLPECLHLEHNKILWIFHDQII